jgi:hypothetical protein
LRNMQGVTSHAFAYRGIMAQLFYLRRRR